MKKIVLAAFAVFAFASVNAQDFNAGLSFGLPIGDAGDSHTFTMALDINYLWNVSEKFDAGIATGYSNSFGDKFSVEGEIDGVGVIIDNIRVDDVGFLPIAAAGRFSVSDKLTLGADLGYAIGITPSENNGGFYYAPKIQYAITDAISIVAAYRGVSVDFRFFDIIRITSFDTITLGVEFGF